MTDWHRPLSKRERIAAGIAFVAGVLWALVFAVGFLMAAPSPVGAQESTVTIALDSYRGTWSDSALTTVTLAPTTQEGAVAEVRIKNRSVNGSRDNGVYHLAGAGTEIAVTFEWDRLGAADRFAVKTEPGLIAVPEELWLDEYADGVIYLYPFQAEGM